MATHFDSQSSSPFCADPSPLPPLLLHCLSSTPLIGPTALVEKSRPANSYEEDL